MTRSVSTSSSASTKTPSASSLLVKKLVAAKSDTTLKKNLRFDRVTIDSKISKAIVDLLYNHKTCGDASDSNDGTLPRHEQDELATNQPSRHWDSLEFTFCKGDVDVVINKIFQQQQQRNPPSSWLGKASLCGKSKPSTRTSTSDTVTGSACYTSGTMPSSLSINKIVIHGRNEYLRVLSSIRNGLQSTDNAIQLKELVIQAAITTSVATYITDCINKNVPYLQVLDLSRCYFVHHEATTILANGIKRAFAANDGATTTTSEISQLKTLRLSNCSLDDTQISELVRAIHATYDMLDSSADDGDNEYGIQELALELNFCHSLTIDAISQMLQSPNCRLRRLHMGQQFIGSQHVLDVEPICRALQVNTSLKYFDLKENFCNDEQMIHMAEVIAHNATLVELNLSCIEIGDVGVGYIANSLAKNHTLKRLYLHHNPLITKSSIEQLHDALQSNTTIEILELRGRNQFSTACPTTAAVQSNRYDGDDTTTIATTGELSLSTSSHRSIIDIDNIEQDVVSETLTATSVSDESVDDGGDGGDCSVGGGGCDTLIKRIQLLLCLNRCGRKYMKCPNSIPLSHWPVLLEQANKAASCNGGIIIRRDEYYFGGIQSHDLVYHLLQGPALFHR